MIAHLIACTAAAFVAVAATAALRGRGAGLRHTILFAAVVRFAVPTGWLASAGREMAPYAFVSVPADALGDLTRLLLRTDPGIAAARLAAAPAGNEFWLYLAGIAWAAGFLWCFARWVRASRHRIPAVRLPSTAEVEALRGAAVELRIAPADQAPGSWGIWKPQIVLPAALAEQLAAAELRAVVAHELAHIRRHDNLMAAVVRATISVFWFHPLLWWIERRMLAEREAACDELVLAGGAQPEDYVSGILKVCRMAFRGPVTHAGIAGSNLQSRMEEIMSANTKRPTLLFLRAAAGMVVGCAILAPLATGFLRAQSPPAATTPRHAEAEAQFGLGTDSLAIHRYTDAEQAFRRAYEIDPTYTWALTGLVEVYLLEQRPDYAIRVLQVEIAKNPGRRDLHLALGNLLVRTGRYDQAITQFQTILTGMQDSAAKGDVYLRLGETYRRKGDLKSAADALRHATELAPGNAVAESALAVVLDQSGQTDAAAQSYRAAIQADPNNGIALNNLAYLIAEHGGDLNQALDYARRAVQAMPRLPDAKDTLGWIYLKKGMPHQAVPLFCDAVLRDVHRESFRNHLLMALELHGDSVLAGQLRAAIQAQNWDEVEQLLGPAH